MASTARAAAVLVMAVMPLLACGQSQVAEPAVPVPSMTAGPTELLRMLVRLGEADADVLSTRRLMGRYDAPSLEVGVPAVLAGSAVLLAWESYDDAEVLLGEGYALVPGTGRVEVPREASGVEPGHYEVPLDPNRVLRLTLPLAPGAQAMQLYRLEPADGSPPGEWPRRALVTVPLSAGTVR